MKVIKAKTCKGFIENSLKVMKTPVDFSVPGSPDTVLHCGAISMIKWWVKIESFS